MFCASRGDSDTKKAVFPQTVESSGHETANQRWEQFASDCPPTAYMGRYRHRLRASALARFAGRGLGSMDPSRSRATMRSARVAVSLADSVTVPPAQPRAPAVAADQRARAIQSANPADRSTDPDTNGAATRWRMCAVAAVSSFEIQPTGREPAVRRVAWQGYRRRSESSRRSPARCAGWSAAPAVFLVRPPSPKPTGRIGQDSEMSQRDRWQRHGRD